MPRPRNVEAREETTKAIKAVARQQLGEKGTNGISLRGIARELGMTAPAIYNYFPRLDDLITALIIDAFNGHADAIDEAISEQSTPVNKLRAGLQAYRQWALKYPSDFQLIYGNPIPAYTAPSELTTPLASRPQAALFRCIAEEQENGNLVIPNEYKKAPASIVDFISTWIYDSHAEIRDIPNHMEIFYMMQVGWSRMHGIIMLEIHEHITPTIGDVETFYNNELDTYLHAINLLK